ncbi:MAG: hypothetical protein AAB353_12545 [Candidatus Hydrogenedentota bacterium]
MENSQLATGSKAQPAAKGKAKKAETLTIRRRASKLALRAVEFQRTAYDRTATTLNDLQERAENGLLDRVKVSKRLPNEAKAVVTEWIKFSQKNRESFTKTVEKSYDLVGQLIERAGEAQKVNKAVAA